MIWYVYMYVAVLKQDLYKSGSQWYSSWRAGTKVSPVAVGLGHHRSYVRIGAVTMVQYMHTHTCIHLHVFSIMEACKM
jgi:hypothetical protein